MSLGWGSTNDIAKVLVRQEVGGTSEMAPGSKPREFP
jgi:hypothetical protein